MDLTGLRGDSGRGGGREKTASRGSQEGGRAREKRGMSHCGGYRVDESSEDGDRRDRTKERSKERKKRISFGWA